MTKRALIVAGQGVQDVEYLYPYYRLQEAGYAVDVATPRKEACTGIVGIKIAPANYDASNLMPWIHSWEVLILPGGVKAMEHLRLDSELLEFIGKYHEAGGVIGCICSGAQLLISAKLAKGRAMSGYYAMRDDIENAGATFVDQPAVTFDRIVTSPHYKHVGPWMAAVLNEVEAARALANAA